MDKTPEFIIEQVSPIFNKKGYVATSFADITKATKLTKGAVYFHFKNKEELAVNAFYHNLKNAVGQLKKQLAQGGSATGKLFVITNYYRTYYERVMERGGCPILNVGVDAKANNELLYQASKKASNELIEGLKKIIKDGIESDELNPNIDPKAYAQNIYSMIEGAVFMAVLNEDNEHLLNITNHIETIIRTQMISKTERNHSIKE